MLTSHRFASAPGPSLRRPTVVVAAVALVVLTATACQASGPPPPSPLATTFAASTAALSGWGVDMRTDEQGSSSIHFEYQGTATFDVRLTNDTQTLALVVKGDQCEGAPTYALTVDGAPVASGTVASTTWVVDTYQRPLLAGRHSVVVAYTNDHQWLDADACDRNLYLESIRFEAAPWMPVTSNAPTPGTGFVHQAGTQLLDGSNRPLQLRGVNLGGWLSWEGWMWSEDYDFIGQSQMMANLASLVGPDRAGRFQRDVVARYVTGDDFRAMSRYGVNVARVPINSKLLEADAAPYTYQQTGWAVLDALVAQARANNVYLVLDLHAAPCAQIPSFISDWSGWSYLWFSQDCQDRATALWKAIAARYANQRIIAGYDLLNETVTDAPQLLSWYQRTTAAIRSVDPNHTLIYEGSNLARDFDFIPAGLDTNMMLSAHDYPWMTWGQVLSQRMPAYTAAAARVGAPMWIGEFGQSSYDDIASYVTTFEATPTFAGYALWSWKQAAGAATIQGIRHTAASKELVDWITDPSRPKPTPAEAEQGMADWIDAITFVDTVPDARTVQILTAR